jgi:MFS family permease
MAISNSKGWSVVLAGTGINLALGVLYTWSIFKGAISDSIKQGGPDAFQWDPASINDPYAVCCLMFAFSMILAGKCQDRLGPRLTAMMGGLLVAAGFILLSQTTNYWLWVVGFGVMAGMGFGFGYSSATPPALKWFPPARTGLIVGIVVSGFALASVYIAPLSTYLLKIGGISWAMMVLGIAFAIIVSLFSLLLANPPAGYTPS